MKRFVLILAAVTCGFSNLGCEGTDAVIVDDSQWLQDGAALYWKCEPGTYKVELTANNDGAAVEWVGAPCAGTTETEAYSDICEFSTTGQVIVTNPSVLNAGLARPASLSRSQSSLARCRRYTSF